MEFLNLLWIVLLIAAFVPVIRKSMLDSTRLRLLRRLEEKRGSRVIVFIHRQESLSFLGFPVSRYINIEDSEQILRAIKLTDPNLPIDLIIHTPGGLVLASEQIANALSKHPARVTVFVPHYAMSGGTLIALAADEVVMDENAVLGPVDPQIGEFPAVSILNVLETKDRNKVDDRTLILADIAQKAVRQVKETIRRVASHHYEPEQVECLQENLGSGKWTHDYPITVDEARIMCIHVNTDMPTEIYQMMNLYPQTSQRRPSVEYIPQPYSSRPPFVEREEPKNQVRSGRE
jgi:ClpP class serine protease